VYGARECEERCEYVDGVWQRRGGVEALLEGGVEASGEDKQANDPRWRSPEAVPRCSSGTKGEHRQESEGESPSGLVYGCVSKEGACVSHASGRSVVEKYIKIEEEECEAQLIMGDVDAGSVEKRREHETQSRRNE